MIKQKASEILATGKKVCIAEDDLKLNAEEIEIICSKLG